MGRIAKVGHILMKKLKTAKWAFVSYKNYKIE